MRSYPLLFPSLLLLLVCMGCASTSRDVRGRDHGALIPAGRVRIDLQHPERRDWEKEVDPYGPRKIMELELDFSGSDGDLSSSGMEFGDYRLMQGAASFRFGQLLRDRVQFVGLAGLGFNRLELLDRRVVPTLDDNRTEFGGHVGLEFRIKFQSWLWLHSRVSAFFRPFDMASTQAEASLLLGNPDVAAVHVGFRDWRYKDESSKLFGVDELDLRVNGPFLGLEVRF